MKNVLKPVAKSVLMPLGFTAAAINKKMFVSGTTTLVFSNEDLNDIMEIIKSPR